MSELSKQKQQQLYRFLLVATILVLAGGTVAYRLIERWSWVDCYYFCVVTLATIGYGDFTPQTTFGKIFTTFYIFIGIGILGAFIRTFLSGRSKKFLDEHNHNNIDKP